MGAASRDWHPPLDWRLYGYVHDIVGPPTDARSLLFVTGAKRVTMGLHVAKLQYQNTAFKTKYFAYNSYTSEEQRNVVIMVEQHKGTGQESQSRPTTTA